MPVTTAAPEPNPAEASDIADVVGQRTVLHPCGPGVWRGTCPFCRSKAFHVRPRHGTFHCSGCGEGGDRDWFTATIDHRRR